VRADMTTGSTSEVVANVTSIGVDADSELGLICLLNEAVDRTGDDADTDDVLTSGMIIGGSL
jgi:hypothetical protein